LGVHQIFPWKDKISEGINVDWPFFLGERSVHFSMLYWIWCGLQVLCANWIAELCGYEPRECWFHWVRISTCLDSFLKPFTTSFVHLSWVVSTWNCFCFVIFLVISHSNKQKPTYIWMYLLHTPWVSNFHIFCSFDFWGQQRKKFGTILKGQVTWIDLSLQLQTFKPFF